MNIWARVLLVFALGLIAPQALASFADGVAAFKAGDYETAAAQWRGPAEQGHAESQHNMGILYNYGLGTAVDMEEAARWYGLAADQGNANAQTKLGIFFAQGLGVTQDYARSVRWFREAAEQMNAEAQYNLGVLYATGKGVEKDLVQALMWLNLAHGAGVKQAARPRENLMAAMAPEDVEEALLLGEIIKPAGAGGSTEDDAAPGNRPTIAVQLASYPSKEAAIEGWTKLRQVNGDLLGKLRYGLSTVSLGEQGVFYRLHAGPFETKAAAQALCGSLKRRNIYCATGF